MYLKAFGLPAQNCPPNRLAKKVVKYGPGIDAFQEGSVSAFGDGRTTFAVPRLEFCVVFSSKPLPDPHNEKKKSQTIQTCFQ